MARIRTIKPEFFTSEDIVDLSPQARLIYIALWCEADREGRLRWKPRTICMRYFPADSWEFSDHFAELIDSGLVVKYQVDGKEYAEIPSFNTHQVINNRETASAIPSRVSDASGTRVHAPSRKGREGKGEDASKTRFTPPTYGEVAEYARQRKSNIDPQRFLDHYESVGWKVGKNKMQDWKAAFRGWETRSRNDQPQRPKLAGVI